MTQLPPPLLILITGNPGAGKTTFITALTKAAREAGWRPAGLLSNAVYTGNRRTAIQTEDVASGEIRVLATRLDEQSDVANLWVYDLEIVAWGNSILQSCYPCDLLVIDELGPLEFEQGSGWQAGLEAVDSRGYAIALVVVRAELLGEALLRWPDANLVEIDTLEESAYKAQIVADQLF